MRLIVQCTYPENYTPPQVRQKLYPQPSLTITRLLHNVELKVYSSLYGVYDTEEPLFSGQREFVKMYCDFLDNGLTNHLGVCACVVLLFVQKWYLLALLAIVLYLTLLALLLERYIQRLDRVL